MADTNNSQDNTEPKMPQEKSAEIQCPNCGSKNPSYAVFCPDCGKKIKEETPSPDEKTPQSYQPPPAINAASSSPRAPKSHRSRKVVIALMIGIIAVGLIAGVLSVASRLETIRPQRNRLRLQLLFQP